MVLMNRNTKQIVVQCFLKVSVHLGYGRVQLKCDGARKGKFGKSLCT